MQLTLTGDDSMCLLDRLQNLICSLLFVCKLRVHILLVGLYRHYGAVPSDFEPQQPSHYMNVDVDGHAEQIVPDHYFDTSHMYRDLEQLKAQDN